MTRRPDGALENDVLRVLWDADGALLPGEINERLDAGYAYTSIATNLLFFEKGQPTQDVWFFEHPYPDGYKSYSRGKPLTIAEFDLEKKWWGGATRKGRKASQYAWKVSAKDIAARNYNLDCKNPHEVAVNHRDPSELMEEYQEIVRQLAAAQNALKAELMQVLGGKA